MFGLLHLEIKKNTVSGKAELYTIARMRRYGKEFVITFFFLFYFLFEIIINKICIVLLFLKIREIMKLYFVHLQTLTYIHLQER